MKKTVSPSPFKALLRQSGFKATPGRIAVLGLLSSSKKPLSITDILTNLKAKDLDQATIYRMMQAFEQKQLVRQIDFRHGHAHYELSTKNHHHHIICETCGKVVDISKCNISALEKEAVKMAKFAEVTHHSLEFFGVCENCAKKNK